MTNEGASPLVLPDIRRLSFFATGAEGDYMPLKRIILELGAGNDLHGGDYTKAALRAVQDALHHSSLTMLRALKVNPKTSMFVNVTIGVQQPDKVDVEKVRASLPHGIVTVN